MEEDERQFSVMIVAGGTPDTNLSAEESARDWGETRAGLGIQHEEAAKRRTGFIEMDEDEEGHDLKYCEYDYRAALEFVNRAEI